MRRATNPPIAIICTDRCINQISLPTANRDLHAIDALIYAQVLRRIYWQGVDDAGSVRQVDAEALDDPCPAAGYEQYLSLYSPRFHRESGPVVARLDECRPTRLREEIAEAAVLGIPGLFWVFVSAQLIEYGRQTGRM